MTPRRPHGMLAPCRRLVLGLAFLFAAAPLPLLCADDEPAPKTVSLAVRVVSYNAWLLPHVSQAYAERKAKLVQALRALKPDVLCLQEVWSGADQGFLKDALQAELPHAHRAVGGLLLLSRFEIESAVFTRFPADPELPLRERIAGKGYLDVRLKTPVGAVRIVTCHLAAMPHADSPRSRQLTHLLAHLAKDRHEPLVLAGDLNMPALQDGQPTADWKRLVAAGFVDLNPPTRNPDETWSDGVATWFSWPRRERAGHRRDYVCTRETRTLGIQSGPLQQGLCEPTTALSDHNAQVAALTLRVRPPAAAPAAR